MREGKEELEEEEWWSGSAAAISALFPLMQHCFLMTPEFGIFLQAVLSYFAGRCRIFSFFFAKVVLRCG